MGQEKGFFRRNYAQKINEKIKKMEEKQKSYATQIAAVNKEIQQQKEYLAQLQHEETRLHQEYTQIKNILLQEGLIFVVPNEGEKIEQWENLELVKKGRVYQVQSKKGNNLKTLEGTFSLILSEILEQQKKPSILVMRVDHKKLVVQLRFL